MHDLRKFAALALVLCFFGYLYGYSFFTEVATPSPQVIALIVAIAILGLIAFDLHDIKVELETIRRRLPQPQSDQAAG